jgi:hypothetical protein
VRSLVDNDILAISLIWFGDRLGDTIGDGLGDTAGDGLGDGLGNTTGDRLGDGLGSGVGAARVQWAIAVQQMAAYAGQHSEQRHINTAANIAAGAHATWGCRDDVYA